MAMIKLVLTFATEDQANEFFADHKYRLRAAGLRYCTLTGMRRTGFGVCDLEYMLVGEDPSFVADQDYLDWAKADPAPQWYFQNEKL